MSIHLLAPDVAAKIAAGEVVERPANVIKELIENSLDAEATEIRVEIREGGQRLMRVTDNGYGIPAEEVPLAFARHATSKLATAEDLNHIGTYGFRGEALYSIAAVSHLQLSTRSRDASFGQQVRLQGGEIVEQGRAGSPVGTMITVEHLFFNVPARKKFLRKPATEAGQISSIVQRYALAYPDRRFSLVNEGRLVFQSTGSGELFDVLVKVYGLDNAKQMVGLGPHGLHGDADAATPDHGAGKPLDNDLADDVDFMALTTTPGNRQPHHRQAGTDTTDATDARDAPVRVAGYTSLPSLTRANRSAIDLFVNRRYIEDRTLTHAVVQAYHTLLPVGRYPIAVVFVELDPSLVDVNVHPQKTQVRFVEERRLFSLVQRAVRRALLQNAPVPGLSPERPDHEEDPQAWAQRSGWAARRSALLNAGSASQFNPRLDPSTTGQGELDFYVPQPAPNASPTDRSGPVWGDIGVADDALDGPVDEIVDGPVGQTPVPQGVPSHVPPRQVEVKAQARQLPPLRVVGQVGALYIIAEGPEGLFLIDQHAAHERILYEQFMAQRYGAQAEQNRGADSGENDGERDAASGVARQQLLEPLTLHTGHQLTGLVAHHLDELRTVGFEIEAFGGDTYLVRGIPAVLSGQDPLRTLEEIVATLAEQRNQVGEVMEQALVKMICKRAAIKAGQLLSPLEMQELVRQLEACQSPRTCPHGRPTMIQLSAGELEKAFGRI